MGGIGYMAQLSSARVLGPLGEQVFVKLQFKAIVDITFAWDHNDNDDNPHLNIMKGTVLGIKNKG